ncbi:MAG: PhoH family protein [Deltaproteobacteria bacterium]|nr:MAG: PhoH family protein [Deltaproteobacteria bacterium]
MAELEFSDARRVHELFGSHDRTARAIEDALGVKLSVTSSGVSVSGSPHDADLAARLLEEFYEIAGEGYPVGPEDVARAVEVLSRDSNAKLREVFLDPVLATSSRSRIVPRTANQKAYFEAMRRHDVVFAIGPAGTGKTYLAMAMAVAELLKGRYSRIILTRPAVEAGEKLGFLPGDLAEKVNPYLRPLYDALYDMVSIDKARQMVERGTVEVAPLAFMRGRTLNNAFVILDEAQNTTREQMKMFLTRLGFSSKAVITGDITQVDLPEGRISGLKDARKVLADIKDIAFVWFDESDVVRHPLVRAIIGAYDAAENGRRK